MLGFMALRTVFKGPVARGLAPRGQYGFESVKLLWSRGLVMRLRNGSGLD